MRLKVGTLPAEDGGPGGRAHSRAPGQEAAGMGAERRKYPRIPTDQVISFSMVDADDRLALGKNVSAGGIRFEAVGCELDLGDTICVTFNLGDRTVQAIGRVSWATETDPITTDIGLEFIAIDPAALRLLEEESGSLSSV